jgi:hypothetical protein
MSTKPGVTTHPVASISPDPAAVPPSVARTLAMRPARISTSPRKGAVPVPSTIRPFRTVRSLSGMVCSSVRSLLARRANHVALLT